MRYRALPICGGAAMRWCWNRPAPAHCSEFAIRRSPRPLPCCPRRKKSVRSGGRPGFPGIELLALLVDCQILFRIDANGDGLRASEGDDNLVLWDFHDLLFHTRSTEGRQANPLGGLYPYAGLIPPPPAVRPRWPGKKIDLRKVSATSFGSTLAVHEAPARTPFDARLRRRPTDHPRRACTVSR